MKRVLNIYYCWDETGNANSNQNRRQHSVLSRMFSSTVVYRKFTNQEYGKDFVGVRSANLLLFDRIFLKLFQSLKLVWSVHIWLWGHKTKNKIKGAYDVVLLTGTPYMLFGMAKKIAKKSGARLVVQMYDPLSMNNYVGGSVKYRERLERRIVEQSDLVIIHSELMHRLMCQRYGSHCQKLKFTPFCSDPDITNPDYLVARNDRITLVHAGNLQNDRNINLLIEAIRDLSLEYRERINIQLIGATSSAIARQIADSGLEESFEQLPFMNKEKLYGYFERADVLLAIDSMKDEMNIFFPSKICEYLLFSKPIFLLTPPVSETRRIFQNSPELCFSQTEKTKLTKTLQALVNDRHTFDKSLDYSCAEQFAPQQAAANTAKYINELFG